MHAVHLEISGQPDMATQVSVSCAGMWDQSDGILITSHPSYQQKSNFLACMRKILLRSNNRVAVNSLSFTKSSKRMFFKSWKSFTCIQKCTIWYNGIKNFWNNERTIGVKLIPFWLTGSKVNWPQTYFMPTFLIPQEIREGFTYNGHFLLQVIHVLVSPLLLLGGSVIFVLCGGNAVTVWPPILQTHTHVLYMPSD